MIEYETGFFGTNAAYIPLDEQPAPAEEGDKDVPVENPADVETLSEHVALEEHPEDAQDEAGEPPADDDDEAAEDVLPA